MTVGARIRGTQGQTEMFPLVEMFSCRFPRLTLFGRSALLIVVLLFVNALLWTVAGILFGKDKNTQPILSLALLAWVSAHETTPVITILRVARLWAFAMVSYMLIIAVHVLILAAIDADHIR